MSQIPHVIHGTNPAGTRLLQKEDLIEYLEVQRFDQLLAHQYCVRRFFLHYPEEFLALCSIRSEIEAVFDDVGLTRADSLFMGSSVTATARCMRILHSKRARNLAAIGEKKQLLDILEMDLESTRSMAKILPYVPREQRSVLVEILCKNVGVVEKINREFNFLDYYDPFSLSCFVSGEVMLTHYFAAKYGSYHLKYLCDEILRIDHRWLRTREAECDEELANIVCYDSYRAASKPSNVEIYGHNQHRIYINDVELKDCLVLAVPTCGVPLNIDAALQKFRVALIGCFIENHGCYANVSTPEFDNSLFMRLFEGGVFAVTETRQYRSRLSGLWVWDLVHPGGDKKKLTVADAVNKVADEMVDKLARFAPDELLYDESSLKNYYDVVVKSVGPKPTGKTKIAQKPGRDLDFYLTSGTGIVGRRDVSA